MIPDKGWECSMIWGEYNCPQNFDRRECRTYNTWKTWIRGKNNIEMEYRGNSVKEYELGRLPESKEIGGASCTVYHITWSSWASRKGLCGWTVLDIFTPLWVGEWSVLFSAVSKFMCWFCKCKIFYEEFLFNKTVLSQTTVIDLMWKLCFDYTEGKFALYFSVG
jgi:hypothetical protein